MRSTIRWALLTVAFVLAAVVSGPIPVGAATLDPGLLALPVLATLNANVLTLSDWGKRIDPNGKIAQIIEMLGTTNEILADMLWMQGNLPTGHRTTVRTGLPAVAWRLLNQGVQPSKSTTAQQDDQAGKLEAWSEVDVALAKLSGDVNQFRLQEAQAFIEAMNQEMASTLFYGNSSVDPEEFTGLSIRYSSLAAANGQNIVNAGGVGADNTSIWLIVWGANTVHGIFPQGSQAGLTHNNFGEETVETTNGVGGARMRAYRDQFIWDAGLSLRDWRYAVRIANIDVSMLVANDANSAKLFQLMTKATWRIPSTQVGRAAIYLNRTVGQFLDIQAQDKVTSGGQLSYEVIDGRRVMTFRGIPIRVTDALLETEAAVS